MIRRDIRRAFTLIELLLVLVILAVLAGVVVPMYINRTGQAKHDATVGSISNLETAVDTFNTDTGRYPSTEEGFGALMTAPTDVAANWHGPYIKQMPNDGWGHPMQYRFPSSSTTGTPYDIWSNGQSGVEGGDDNISNHAATPN